MLLLQSISAFATLGLTNWKAGLSGKESAAVISGGAVFAIFFMVLHGGPDVEMFFPYTMLVAAAAFTLFFFSRKIIFSMHEGMVFINTITLIYAIFLQSSPVRGYILLLLSPLLIWLAIEIISSDFISEFGCFVLGLLQCCAALYLSGFQLFAARDFVRSQFEIATYDAFTFLIITFLFQLTVYSVVVYGARLLSLLPGRRESHYVDRLKTEVIPNIAAIVRSENVPTKVVILAGLLHAIPLTMNAFLHWVTPSVMISYSVVISPLLIDFVIRHSIDPA